MSSGARSTPCAAIAASTQLASDAPRTFPPQRSEVEARSRLAASAPLWSLASADVGCHPLFLLRVGQSARALPKGRQRQYESGRRCQSDPRPPFDSVGHGRAERSSRRALVHRPYTQQAGCLDPIPENRVSSRAVCPVTDEGLAGARRPDIRRSRLGARRRRDAQVRELSAEAGGSVGGMQPGAIGSGIEDQAPSVQPGHDDQIASRRDPVLGGSGVRSDDGVWSGCMIHGPKDVSARAVRDRPPVPGLDELGDRVHGLFSRRRPLARDAARRGQTRTPRRSPRV